AGQWRTLTADEFDRHPAGRFKSEYNIRRVRRLDLGFYENGHLIEFEYVDANGIDRMWSGLVINDDLFYRLDVTSPPIHEANKVAPLRLKTVDEAASYLRFFCSYVSGEQGTFQLPEYGEDLPWSTSADVEARLLISRALRPMVV